MLFRYVLAYRAGRYDHIEVQAFYRTKYNPDAEELELEIGRLEGPRATLLRAMVDNATAKFGSSEDNDIKVVHFPEGEDAAAHAYRIGLCTAALSHAPDRAACERLVSYIEEVSDEEVSFWTRKLMDREVGADRATAALCIMSGSMRVRPSDR